MREAMSVAQFENNTENPPGNWCISPLFNQMVVFLGPPDHYCPKNPIYNQYRFFMEGTAGFSCPYIKPILEEENLLAAIALTTRTAYNYDFISWIEQFLDKREKIHPLVIEQIITVAHEAIANGLMWSNLELEPQEGKIRSLEFAENIAAKLDDPEFSKRYIILSLIMNYPTLEIRISVEGKPIYWDKEAPDHFRGTAIIRELSDGVVFLDHNQTISLYFNVDREQP